ncbi:MAG: hypothetical protein AB1420_15095 [Bacillota bacterium]
MESYAAHVLGGIRAKVVVPETIPQAKLEKIKHYGAEVILCDRLIGDRQDTL